MRYGARQLGMWFLIAFAGCASLRTTPQQEYTLGSFGHCERAGTRGQILLDRVDPDGRYWYRHWGAYDQQAFLDCMAQYRREHPFLEWMRARGTAPGIVVAPPSVGVGSAAQALPTWTVGDRWEFAYTSPAGSGSYVWVVDRRETLDGVDNYVIKVGTREIFYRASDFASTMERVDGVIVLRYTPPRTSFAWPLAVEKTWEQTYQLERPVNRSVANRDAVWRVESEENVTVLAGTFRTFKISLHSKNTGALVYEMWMAPEVKLWVKVREVITSGGVSERELMSFKIAQPTKR